LQLFLLGNAGFEFFEPNRGGGVGGGARVPRAESGWCI
jgi:hypothetical protein